MVMPRSRSRSIESRTCARMSRGSTVCVSSRMRSASVDLPWSMWAMIEKLRMRRWSAMGLAVQHMDARSRLKRAAGGHGDPGARGRGTQALGGVVGLAGLGDRHDGGEVATPDAEELVAAAQGARQR